LYSEGAALFGLSHGQEHELEGLARLDDGADASRLEDLITYRDGALRPSPQWKAFVLAWLADAVPDALTHQARVASAFQHHLGSLLLAFACDFRQRTGMRRLCVGGGLFYNTFFTTLLCQSGIFEDVFIAPNPGNAGTAIGAVLDGADDRHPSSGDISPFLGPEYSGAEIKATLENCKLSYECLSEEQVIATTVKAIAGGQLVGWFQGRMEWAQRALGHRSILANPLSPYALDNLNTFLKHRPRHRAYGVSIPIDRVAEFFNGPPVSRFMEYEYRPSSLETFQHMMPSGMQTLRVQTIDRGTKDGSNARYERLHREFGKVTNVPVLVNTSFNGFSEPMVCSPRDAIRVFFGTGLDLLVLDRFVVRK
jgi:carbamoyltransferase